MPDASRSTEEIEQEIERSRASLSDTLSRLQDSFSPDAMAEKFGGELKERSADLINMVSRNVRENPAAVVLTGIGVAWLILGSGGKSRPATAAQPLPSRQFSDPQAPAWTVGRDYGEDAELEIKASLARLKMKSREWKDRLAEGTDGLSEEAKLRVLIARERALYARDRLETAIERQASKASDLFQENTLAAGALAAAAGAAIGGMLPRSDFEDRHLGRYSDRLFDEAETVFRDEVAKARQRSEDALREAKSAAAESLAGE